MAREKFQTLTEQMFYILLSLQEELCGADVMSRVESLTDGGSPWGREPSTTCWMNFSPPG